MVPGASKAHPDQNASNGLMTILLQPYPPSNIGGLRLPAQETPIRMHHAARPGTRGRSARALWVPVLFAAALVSTGCSEDPFTQPSPDTTPPTTVTETFEGTLTVNGGITQPFIVQTAGTIVARIAALEPAEAVVGVGIGT